MEAVGEPAALELRASNSLLGHELDSLQFTFWAGALDRALAADHQCAVLRVELCEAVENERGLGRIVFDHCLPQQRWANRLRSGAGVRGVHAARLAALHQRRK